MHKAIKYAIATILILLLVWGLGPYLAIGNVKPFANTMTQTLITLVFVIAWVIYSVVKLWMHIHLTKLTPSEIDDDVERQLLEITETQLKDVRKDIKEKPWIFLIGGAQSGKTALLAQSDFTFHSPSKRSILPLLPTKFADFWISEHAVFVDASGNISEEGWQSLLQLGHRYHQAEVVDHLVICINIETLFSTDQQQIEDHISLLNQQIMTILQHNSGLNVSITITQCDRIPGFTEFFSELNQDEREDNFGIKLSNAKDSMTINETLQTLLQEFIEHIGNRLIWRMHHEQSVNKRAQIKDFPAEMEQVCQALTNMIPQLPWSENVILQHIFFTSSEQHNNLIDMTAAPLKQAFDHVNKTTAPPRTQSYPFFIKQAIIQMINNAKVPFQQNQRFLWSRWLIIPIATIAVLAMILVWHQDYIHNLRGLGIVQSNLDTLKSDQKFPAGLQWLAQLEVVQKTLNQLQQHDKLSKWTGLSQLPALKNSLQERYNNLLKQHMQPYLQKTLTEQLRKDITGNKVSLYNTLRIYLMLTDQQRYNAQTVQQWFMNYWRSKYSKNIKVQNQLSKYLTTILQSHKPTWQPQTDLIQQVRTTLKKLSPAQLAFLELQSKYSGKNIPIFANKTVIGLDLSNATIPSFYSAQKFNNIYTLQIPKIVSELNESSWVINDQQQPQQLTATQQKAIIKKVRDMYLQHYTKQWQDVAGNILLKTPESIADVQQRISLLTKPNSALYQLLHIIIGNAELLKKAGLTTDDINPNFLTLNAFVNKPTEFTGVTNALDQLNKYLEAIQKAKNSDQASFLAAKSRMQTQNGKDPITTMLTVAKLAPNPLRSWLETIAYGSWQVLLDNSKHYMDSIWQSKIYPDYQANIANRYPVYAKSDQDISFANFTQFFGPDGTLQSFFQTYLQPFVNISKNYWTWRTKDGKRIAIPQKTLNMLLRGSLIQQMFFTDNKKALGFKFALTGKSVPSTISAWKLNLGSTQATITPTSQQVFQMTWPGSKPSDVSIQFLQTNGRLSQLTSKGDWAWFRILSQATVTPTNNPRLFDITFKSDNESVTVRVLADNIVNPFLPGIVSKFRLPETL